MTPSSKIYVAGHLGLAGSALVRRLKQGGYSNIVGRSHRELDLTDQAAVNGFFEAERPDYVYIAAAKVGGIHANNTYRAEFLYQNIMIQSNLIHASYRHGVKKLMFLGSACMYPRHTAQPMKEDALLTGPLEPTNEPYAIAKIAGVKMCDAYNRQYGTNFMAVMPASLYGPGDNYDPENSHVLPALIRKMHLAKTQNQPEVVLWGTGSPQREFLYCDDFADACVFLMERCDAGDIGEFLNIGSGLEYTIRDIARLVAEIVGYAGRLSFDASKPDGAPRKLVDATRLKELGWEARTPLPVGLSKAYADYRERFASA